MKQPIGVIDSGLGGLTVLFELKELLPSEDYIYIGDQLNCPYGDKSREELITCADKMIDFLLSQNIKSLVIACNSISASYYEELVTKLDIEIFSVINPTSEYVHDNYPNTKIGVIATKRTIDSGVYETKIDLDDVHSLRTPMLVKAIEDNYETEKKLSVVKSSISPLIEKGINTLVLGCTHYPLIKSEISKLTNVKIVDCSEQLALEVSKYYETSDYEGSMTIYSTSDVSLFEEKIKNWFNEDIEVKLLELED